MPNVIDQKARSTDRGCELSLSLFDRFGDVDEQSWLAVCPRESNVFMHPGLMRATEATMAPQARCWYALFHNRMGHPVAAAALSLHVVDASVLATGTAGTIARWIGAIVPRLKEMRIMFLGLPFSSGQSHLQFADGADRQARREVLIRLDRELCRLAGEHRAELIVAKEFEQQDLEWLSILEESGYRRADSLPANYMPAHYGSWEDYLSALKKEKRWKLRRTQKRLCEPGFQKVICQGEEAARRFDSRAYQLYENVLFRSEVRSEHLPASFFTELALQLPDNATYIYYYKDGILAAFGICLHCREQFIAFYAGIDYDLNREYELYFNIVYESVDLGLRRRPQSLWVGANADDTKHQKLGSYQQPRYVYVKGARLGTKLGLKVAFDLFFPPHAVKYPTAAQSRS